MNLRTQDEEDKTLKILINRRNKLKLTKKQAEDEIGDVNFKICSNLADMISNEFIGYNFIIDITVFDNSTSIELFLDNMFTLCIKHPVNILKSNPTTMVASLKSKINELTNLRDKLDYTEQNEVYKYNKKEKAKPIIHVYTSTRTKYF